MGNSDTECSTLPTCSKRLSSASKADSSFEQEWVEVQPQTEEVEKTILAAADKCGMGAHGIKGIINRLYKNPTLLKYSIEAASNPGTDSNLGLPSLKVTRSMKKLLGNVGQESASTAGTPVKQTENEVLTDETARDQNADHGDESSIGGSGDEDFLLSTHGDYMTEDDAMEEEEEMTERDAEEPMECQEQEITEDDMVLPKFANLNDAAIFDDLAQSSHDLFDPGVHLSPGSYGRNLDPDYMNFLSTINQPTQGENIPLFNEEDDDPDYVPQEDPPEEFDFSVRSPDWQEDELYKEFVVTSTVPEYSQNLDIPDDDSEEDDDDYNPQEDEESDDDNRFTRENISKREVRKLNEEIDERRIAWEAQREREQELRKQLKEHRLNNKRERRDFRSFKVSVVADDNSCSLISGEPVTFRHSELSQLMLQMEQHVQLAVQGLAQCSNRSFLKRERNGYQTLINELDALYYVHGTNSFFNIENLAAAVSSCHDLHAVKLASTDYVKWGHAPSDVHGYLPRPETCLVLSRSQAILYPELVPFMQANKELLEETTFTMIEDTLVLLGLIQFGHLKNCSRYYPKGRYYQIGKNLFSIRNKDDIRMRMFNYRRQKDPTILYQLLRSAEDTNPNIAFTPSYTKRLVGGMYMWPEEDLPYWYQKFTEWFTVTNDNLITCVPPPEPEEEFVVTKKRRVKEKPIVKNKDTYGKTNYVCVSKDMKKTAVDREGEEEAAEETQRTAEERGETQRTEAEEKEVKETWLNDTSEYQDMPCLDQTDVGGIDTPTLPAGGINAMMLIGSPEKGYKKIDLTGKKVYIADRDEATSPELFRCTTEDNIPRGAEEISPKKLVLQATTPKNSPEEDENAIKDTQPSAVATDEKEEANDDREKEGTEEAMTKSNATAKSKRKQYLPVKKLPIARKDLRKSRENNLNKSQDAAQKTKDSQDMSRDSEREEMSQDEGKGQGHSRHNGATSSLHMRDYGDMPSLVFPVGGGNDNATRSNSFVPITPHALSLSDVSSSASPRNYPDFMRTPSPDYQGSQLPAPRTPRDDGMTLSPTLMQSVAETTCGNYDLTTGFLSARRRIRNFGPTDFSSIDESQNESDSLQHAPLICPKQEKTINPSMRPGSSRRAEEDAPNKKKKRGREEIMRDGGSAMMDEEYRQRQEGLVAKHVFNDIKKRLSMHRDVLSQINNIMAAEKTPREILEALDCLLRDNHLDSLCLISLTFDMADIPLRLLSDPLRKAYHDALNMIMAIDAYSSQVKYKMSTKHLFRTLKSRCCTGDTTPEDFVTAMRELFRNDKPLWEYLKPHLPMNYAEMTLPQEVEHIDITAMTSVNVEEHVDLSRVMGVPSKKKNKVHVQNGKIYVFKGGSYIPVDVHRASPGSAAGHQKTKPPKVPRKATKRKASPKKAEPPKEPQWTAELDMVILTTYNDMEEDEEEEAVVEALLPKLPFSREQVAARMKFLVEQFDTL